ncbi:MAG TPA: aspartate carbamoyltransferase catalytic subunit [bacterium]|nr:aspartate carbamoyltransferase catalytic subunit [bacterium]
MLGLKDLTRDQIVQILETATRMKAWMAAGDEKLDELKGRAVINLFFEPSTRTRASFELAARKLSADLMTMTPQASSLTKGESLKDMVENLEAMGPALLVVRHAASGVPGLISRYTKAAVINAGDGSHEHPTQGLLDLFTVCESLKIHDWNLKGLNLLIVGDLAYSRVARSNLYGFRKLGARVTCVGPATLLPPGLESFGARVGTDLDRELPDADVVMLLRIQKERQEKMNFPSLVEYTRFYGLTRERHHKMKASALIMHPGPINRGVEIDPDVADSKAGQGAKTVILDQVNHGVPVRMAVLSHWGRPA